MIKRIIVILFLYAMVSSMTAQNKPFQFGFKGGVNAGWFSSTNEDYKTDGVKFGGSWGFVADFFLMDNYSLTTGFDVMYLNGKLRYPELYFKNEYSNPEYGTIERSYFTKYVRIPVVFTMKTKLIKKVRYYAQIGVGISVLLTARSEDSHSTTSGLDPYSEKENIYTDLRPTRESVILGAGVEIPLHKSTYIRTGITFDNSIINILKGNNSIDQSIKHNGRNNYIGIEMSLLF